METRYHGGCGQITCEEAADQIAAITTEELTQYTSQDGAEDGPDANGITRKPKIYTWNFFRLNFGAGFVATYGVHMNNVLYKSNNSSIWKFESISYDSNTGAKKTSGSVPPCLSMTCSASVAGPIISGDQLKAEASLTYSAQVTIACAFNAEAGDYYGVLNGQEFLANN